MKMKQETKERLAGLLTIAMFLFVGLAVNANIHDKLMGTNYAYWLNIIGFCLVPIFAIGLYIWYRKETKNLVKG
jgi:hypothetical protein